MGLKSSTEAELASKSQVYTCACEAAVEHWQHHLLLRVQNEGAAGAWTPGLWSCAEGVDVPTLGPYGGFEGACIWPVEARLCTKLARLLMPCTPVMGRLNRAIEGMGPAGSGAGLA